MLEHGDGEFFRVHAGRGPSTGCGAGRGVVEIRGDASGIDEVGEVIVEIIVNNVAIPAWDWRRDRDSRGGRIERRIRFPGEVVGAADEQDEFTEDGEFEFELDAVDDTLDHGFEDVEVAVFDDEEGQVQSDDDQIDGDELVHDFAFSAVGIETEHADGFPDVEDREDEFLQAEAGHLDLFHDAVAVDEYGWVGGEVGAVGQDGGGDMQKEGVHDNHGEDAAEDFGVREDEVQSRVEHDGLAGYHGVPADGDEGDGEGCGGGEGEVFEEEADGVGNQAESGDEQGPEVGTAILGEGHENEDDQFNGVIPG